MIRDAQNCLASGLVAGTKTKEREKKKKDAVVRQVGSATHRNTWYAHITIPIVPAVVAGDKLARSLMSLRMRQTINSAHHAAQAAHAPHQPCTK